MRGCLSGAIGRRRWNYVWACGVFLVVCEAGHALDPARGSPLMRIAPRRDSSLDRVLGLARRCDCRYSPQGDERVLGRSMWMGFLFGFVWSAR